MRIPSKILGEHAAGFLCRSLPLALAMCASCATWRPLAGSITREDDVRADFMACVDGACEDYVSAVRHHEKLRSRSTHYSEDWWQGIGESRPAADGPAEGSAPVAGGGARGA